MSSIASSFKPFGNTIGDIPDLDLDFDEEDLMGVISKGNTTRGKLLDKYTEGDILDLFIGSGITQKLHQKGYCDLRAVIDTSDPFVHKLTVYDGEESSIPLIQLFLRMINDFNYEHVYLNLLKHSHLPYTMNKRIKNNALDFFRRKFPNGVRSLKAEWLLLQDPKQKFGSERQAFPGQQHPGLGIARLMGGILVSMAGDLGYDCLINNPEHFHNAVMYTPPFKFIDPHFQGFYNALNRDLEKLIECNGLAKVSWGIRFGNVMICTKSGQQPYKWKPFDQTMPLSDKMKSYLRSSEYLERERRYQDEYAFVYDDVAGNAAKG